jgi:hypothetical protein
MQTRFPAQRTISSTQSLYAGSGLVSATPTRAGVRGTLNSFCNFHIAIGDEKASATNLITRAADSCIGRLLNMDRRTLGDQYCFGPRATVICCAKHSVDARRTRIFGLRCCPRPSESDHRSAPDQSGEIAHRGINRFGGGHQPFQVCGRDTQKHSLFQQNHISRTRVQQIFLSPPVGKMG